MYINIESGNVVTRAQLEFEFPQVAFPAQIADEVLIDFGYANLASDPVPAEKQWHRIVKGSVRQEDGKYFQTWVYEIIETDPVALLAVVKKDAIARNNAAYDQATLSVTNDYPQLEKDTWPTQDKEIKAYQADPENAITPWIDTAAATRGLDRVDYLNRTIAKVALFEQASAYLTGLRQRYEDCIKAAESIEDVELIIFSYNLGA